MNPILDAPFTPEAKFEYAGFWIRFVAVVIDAIIVGLVDLSLRFAIFGTIFVENDDGNGMGLIYTIVMAVAGVAYYVVLESSSKQGTIGKMAVGIKVGNEAGQRISPANAIGRYFAKILSAIILLIGYIMAAFDPRKQALHDKIAGTVVYYG